MKFLKSIRARWTNSCALVGAMLALAPVPAWASGSNQTEVESMVDSILNLLTGSIAKGIAAIALVLAGFMFFFGHGNKSLLASIMVGCFIVFGADWIVDQISA